MDPRPKILAVDGNSLICRAYFALPNTIRDLSGRPINAVHGFVSMLTKLIREHAPEQVIVAYDSPWPTLRHEIFPEYKGTRQALPNDLLDQVPLAKAVIQGAGIPGIAAAGYEADDILASLAQSRKQARQHILVVTGDRDLFQIVEDPYVRVLYTRRGVGRSQVLDESGVRALVGVSPSRYADFAALRGDPSDNIRGIPGIGTKTALRLIESAPTLEALLDASSDVPSRLIEKLGESRELLYRNRDLTLLRTSVPTETTDPGRTANTQPEPDELERRGLDKLVQLLATQLLEAALVPSVHAAPLK